MKKLTNTKIKIHKNYLELNLKETKKLIINSIKNKYVTALNEQSSVKFQYKSKSTLKSIIRKKNRKMKASLLLVSGLFATSGFCCHELKPENCQISKVNSVDTFKCPITSGSGNFDWHFWDIPDGWIVENDKLTIPKGKYSENQAYGCKVEVYDKNDR